MSDGHVVNFKDRVVSGWMFLTSWMHAPSSATAPRRWSLFSGIAIVWGTSMCVSLFSAVVQGERLPWFIDVVIARPLAITAATGVMIAILSRIFDLRFEQLWSRTIRVFPLAGLVAIGAALIGAWNDGSGAIALPWQHGLVFVVSFGMWPFTRGPESSVRFVLIALVIALAFDVKSTVGLAKTLKGVILAWIASAAVLLLETWMAVISGLIHGLGIPMTIEQVVRAMARLHFTSYWSNFQADRFFSGIGNQLDMSIRLTSSSIFLLICVITWALVARRLSTWSRGGVLPALGKRLWNRSLLFVVVPCIIGAFIARQIYLVQFQFLEIISLALLVTSILSWFAWWRFGRDLDRLAHDERHHPDYPLPAGLIRPDELQTVRHALLLFLAIASFLLGWPVFLPMMVLVVISWAASSNMYGWMETIVGEVGMVLASATALFLVSAAYVARSPILPSSLLRYALAWGVLLATGEMIARLTHDVPDRFRRTFAWVAIGGALFALFLQQPILLAILILDLLLLLWISRRRPQYWNRCVLLFFLAYGVLGTALVLWL